MLQISWAEVFGSLTGLVSVWLTVRNNVWCWLWGIVSVAVYTVVFWDARLYADMALQLVFVVMNVYGWYEWLHGQRHEQSSGAQASTRRISPIPQDKLLLSGTIGVMLAVGIAVYLRRFTNAAVPEFDAALTALSLVAIWMQARKYRENWLVWLAADVAYVGLFVNRQLWLTAALYLVFCGMAIVGWREWNAIMNRPIHRQTSAGDLASEN